MKTLAIFLIIICLAPCFSQETIFIRKGTIVPVVGNPIPSGDLVIERGIITAIGTDLPVPKGASIIEANGLYVYPGMIAPLTALGLGNPPGSPSDTNEKGLSLPQIDPYDALNPEDDSLEVTRIDGVTTALTAAGTASLINGKGILIHLDGNLAEEMILKRNVLLIFNTSARQANSFPATMPGVLQYFREKLTKAKDYGEKPISTGSKDTEMESLQPILSQKMPVLFQCADEIAIRIALTLTEEFNLEAIISTGSADILKFSQKLTAKSIPVIWGGTTSLPRRWEPIDLYYHTAALLAEKGVLFCFNESRGQGSRSVRRQPVPAAISTAYGLSEEDALRALTINPARILGIDHLIGSIEKGKMADLIICTKPLLQLSSQIRTVIIRGRRIPLTSMQTRLHEKYQVIVRERIRKGV